MREEIKVGVLILVLLLMVEVTLTVAEPMLSGDVKQILEIERVGARVEADSAELKVLWVGNSITANGINLPIADSLFETALNEDVGTYAVHPDGSGIPEWLYLTTNIFFDRGASPEILIVPFGWNLLSDQAPVEYARIGRWYLRSADDWLEFFGNDARDFESRTHAVLANVSASFGNRDRVRNRILSYLPGYEDMAQLLSRGGEATQPSDRGEQVDSYQRLGRLIEAAHVSGTTLVLVAMPLRSSYDLDPSLTQLAERDGVLLIDARDTEGVGPSDFRDAVHLLPAGAARVTEAVVSDLVNRLGTDP